MTKLCANFSKRGSFIYVSPHFYDLAHIVHKKIWKAKYLGKNIFIDVYYSENVEKLNDNKDIHKKAGNGYDESRYQCVTTKRARAYDYLCG
ncbi:hypothetical protein J5TS2_33890 [Brevibacillus halotolerans]|nr:hypothetical protein J5TS2_33890 [Brevibacillus halotolerans]